MVPRADVIIGTRSASRPTPAGFRRLIGAYIDEYWPARDGDTFEVTFDGGSAATGDWWQDSIHPESATVAATYASGLLAGRPAVVENRLGSSRVLYVGTRLAEAALRDIVLGAVREAGVARLVDDAPSFVEAARRGNERGEYLFLLNHSDTEAATVSFAGTGEDLLSGSAVKERLTLPPLALAVIRLDSPQ